MRSKVIYRASGPVYMVDGKEVSKREFEKESKIGGILESGVMHTASTGWPMYSDALGVSPSQIKEAREESIRMGVPTDFTKDGRAILRDKGHRRKYAEANGMYDRNAGYGDPQPKTVTGVKRKPKRVFK